MLVIRKISLLATFVAALASTGLAPAQDCDSDLNDDGVIDANDIALVLSGWGVPTVTVGSFTPTEGGFLGGTAIMITGANLGGTTGVTVGGVPCTEVEVVSSTKVRAITPPGEIGDADVQVISPAGTVVAATPFVYRQFSVVSVEPASGLYRGGTPITISGAYLGGVTEITFGGIPATNVVAVNSKTVTAVTPPGSLGSVDVVVTGPKGTATLSGGFTYELFIVPEWATLIEGKPDPATVTNAALRAAMTATGLPWRVRDNASQIEMVLVPPGTFDMGCSGPSVICQSDEFPIHSVTLTNPFYLGRYEVTQAQWTAVMGSNPSGFQLWSDQVPGDQVPLRPVERVSWDMAQEFNAATGLRLPTEAEWEYAYRAGTTTVYHSLPGFPNGTNEFTQVGNIAWFSSNASFQTHPVGQKPGNAFGLHDMSGNVWEWVNDWWDVDYYQESPSMNPPGPSSGVYRTIRGGSFTSDSMECRSSGHRYSYRPDYKTFMLGFRAARTP